MDMNYIIGKDKRGFRRTTNNQYFFFFQKRLFYPYQVEHWKIESSYYYIICNIVWWASIDVHWDQKNFVTILSVVLNKWKKKSIYIKQIPALNKYIYIYIYIYMYIYVHIYIYIYIYGLKKKMVLKIQ